MQQKEQKVAKKRYEKPQVHSEEAFGIEAFGATCTLFGICSVDES